MIATRNVGGIAWNNDDKSAQKKAWMAFAVVVVLGLIIGVNAAHATPTTNTAAKISESDTASSTTAPAATDTAKDAQPAAAPAPTTTAKDPGVPAEYKSALAKASSYSSTMHMSKQGIYDQLVSEYGEKFTGEAAQYAIDTVKADWNANALAKAKSYQDTQHMSPAAIHDQLVSDYGEKFTAAEADYAIQNLNK